MPILMLLIATLSGSQPLQYGEEIQKHRAQREVDLKGDDGWLTVAGLFWLKEGDNIAGSEKGSDIVLPAKAPARLGTFHMQGGAVTFTADARAHVAVDGAGVRRVALEPDSTALEAGDLRFFLIRRGDRVAIRMRDLRSRMRREFKGLEYFPIRPAYRVRATFVAYPTPRRIPVANVLGQNPEMVSPGYVTFTLNGTRLRLEPVYETEEQEDLFFIFKDLTSGKETYPAGRYLHAPLPRDGEVLLDFNKAYNPPCAFTDFATCPLTPKQNHLKVRIEAGELAYHGPTQ